jgi:hypothetical protein
MRCAVLLLAVLAACDPPAPLLRYRVDSTDVGLCPSSKCEEVPLTCRSFLSIRVVDPGDPTAPYLSQCDEIIGKANLCTIAGIDLDDTKKLPLRGLEVQVAIFPEAMIQFDPMTGEPICPANTKYDATTGFPVSSGQTPAVGGRSFYHPGDDKVVVNLGCTDLESVASCTTMGAVTATAQVIDFDSLQTSISPISVSVGEPSPSDPFWVLSPFQLDPLEPGPGQSWTGTRDHAFQSWACLTVIDDAPQSTTSVVCRAANPDDTLVSWPNPTDTVPARRASSGVRVSKAALDQMLAALSLPSFPMNGLTIGLVLDQNGIPVENQTVTAIPPVAGTPVSIQYFDDFRTSVGATRTSMSGAWVSTDAPFGTSFSTSSGVGVPVTRVGGAIVGKVTIVVLQYGQGTGG